MAYLWVQDDADAWLLLALDDYESVALTGDRVRPVRRRSGGRSAGAEGVRDRGLLIRRRDSEAAWALVAAADGRISVNGQPLALGLRALRDRDAFQIDGGAWFFFSTERLAQVEVIEAAGSGMTCPRCKQAIGTAECPVSGVRCPGCGVVHHQTEELPCWTGYEGEPFATCALCDQPATLGADFRWTPEDL